MSDDELRRTIASLYPDLTDKETDEVVRVATQKVEALRKLRSFLSTELRKAREAAKLTQRQVAEELRWSANKLLRIESGQSSVDRADVTMLIRLYKITNRRLRERLIQEADASHARAYRSRR